MLLRSFRRSGSSEDAMTSSQNFLKVLVDPPDANIDIVAVHGLNPLNRTMHAESTWTAGDSLWLRDFLKKRAPQVRVLLFGYNSNVAFGTAKAGVREHAENLLNRIAAKRAINSNRPLLFICHSLGGLVVKQALVHAKSDNMYKMIYVSTFGIVFFATPHRGGNRSGIGSIAATITRRILGSPANGLMKVLQYQSDALTTISEDFRGCLEDFEFISFFETLNFGPLRVLVVEKESATLGLASEREIQLGLEADHSSICKFASEDDPTYKQVEANIINMINNAVVAGQRRAKGWLSRLSSNVTIPRGNEADIMGNCNKSAQTGSANKSKTNGNDNNTNQFGDDNKTNTYGSRNTVTQMAMEPEQALAFAKAFFLKNSTDDQNPAGE